MLWKENWAETHEHYCRWWAHDGLVVVPSAPRPMSPGQPPRDPLATDPGPPRDAATRHADPAFVTVRSL